MSHHRGSIVPLRSLSLDQYLNDEVEGRAHTTMDTGGGRAAHKTHQRSSICSDRDGMPWDAYLPCERAPLSRNCNVLCVVGVEQITQREHSEYTGHARRMERDTL